MRHSASYKICSLTRFRTATPPRSSSGRSRRYSRRPRRRRRRWSSDRARRVRARRVRALNLVDVREAFQLRCVVRCGSGTPGAARLSARTAGAATRPDASNFTISIHGAGEASTVLRTFPCAVARTTRTKPAVTTARSSWREDENSAKRSTACVSRASMFEPAGAREPERAFWWMHRPKAFTSGVPEAVLRATDGWRARVAYACLRAALEPRQVTSAQAANPVDTGAGARSSGALARTGSHRPRIPRVSFSSRLEQRRLGSCEHAPSWPVSTVGNEWRRHEGTPRTSFERIRATDLRGAWLAP